MIDGLAARKGTQMRVHRAECWGPSGLGKEGSNKGYFQRKSWTPGHLAGLFHHLHAAS